MNYEQSLREVGYSVPSTIDEVVQKATLAKATLNSIYGGSVKTTQRCFHAYQCIVEEGKRAEETDYILPDLVNYMADIASVAHLAERFEGVIKQLTFFVDNHFELDPENIKQYDIDRWVDLLFRLENRLARSKYDS
jgi:hypothetical protein